MSDAEWDSDEGSPDAHRWQRPKNLDPVTRLEALGRRGLTVSICCGPCGEGRQFAWSVFVLSQDGKTSSEVPFLARSFDHAVEVAEAEVKRRWW